MIRSKALRLFPLGVDLVDTRKAKSFYQTHKDDLDSFFSLEEISKIKKSPKPHKRLAIYLAAKEAVYKALFGTKVGMLGFRNILISQNRNRLSFQLDRSLGRRHLSGQSLKLSIVEKKKYVVVQCGGK